jgi:hypothetical protein
MSFIDRLFRKRPKVGPESIHVGHFAAMGAKSAIMLSQHGIRHAAMTREHVMWSGDDGGLRVVGWGNGQKIQWPDRALEHAPDLRTFSDGFGPPATAGFRFGYVYQLGPIAEWLFFAASNPGHENSVPPALWQTQWQPPSKELALGEDGLLVDLDRMLTAGTTDPVVARRLQMARLLRGDVSGDSHQKFSSFEELARLFLQEGRPVRALALGIAAMTQPALQDAAAEEFLTKLMVEICDNTTEAIQLELKQVVLSGQWSSLLELVWRLETFEIAAAISGASPEVAGR